MTVATRISGSVDEMISRPCANERRSCVTCFRLSSWRLAIINVFSLSSTKRLPAQLSVCYDWVAEYRKIPELTR